MEALGIDYLRDVWALRSGDRWSERLREFIDQADVFQLFWSTNAMGSAYVRAEWEYALSTRGTDFIRPVFWEEPFPEDEGAGLPPADLRKVHFAKLALTGPAPARALAVPESWPSAPTFAEPATPARGTSTAELVVAPTPSPWFAEDVTLRKYAPSAAPRSYAPQSSPHFRDLGQPRRPAPGLMVVVGLLTLVALGLLAWYLLR